VKLRVIITKGSRKNRNWKDNIAPIKITIKREYLRKPQLSSFLRLEVFPITKLVISKMLPKGQIHPQKNLPNIKADTKVIIAGQKRVINSFPANPTAMADKGSIRRKKSVGSGKFKG
jgi:hypothetical protein